MRGINRQIIFEDEEDCHKFIQTLQKYREISEYKLYAYCLMGNHLHLLLMEDKDPLETVMRRICGSYVLWYNKKYGRIGPLFQDRFKNEPVEDDAYFLTVLRYILQNPVKAGIVTKVEDYPWTNYTDYIRSKYQTDTDLGLNILNVDRAQAVRKFVDFIDKDNDDKCLEIKENRQITDNDAIKIIKNLCKVERGSDLQMVDVDKRNTYIKELKEGYGLSVRQIERFTGINRGIIQRL
ncbi:transposase [Geosporobacter ferrireducens]|uniref:Transposase n=2 Tax=Geosporobacter ferrireducens TaxID=1424294 RepID=A0A1D8GQW8_9FIRM|nr:transposase [Geosporobacter ferrireducens]MTI56306.1 transposase [Geosporobacter ferrireducens]